MTSDRWIITAAAMLVLVGCAIVRPAPVVQNQTYRIPPGTLKKVAVVPFSYKDTLPKYSGLASRLASLSLAMGDVLPKGKWAGRGRREWSLF